MEEAVCRSFRLKYETASFRRLAVFRLPGTPALKADQVQAFISGHQRMARLNPLMAGKHLFVVMDNTSLWQHL